MRKNHLLFLMLCACFITGCRHNTPGIFFAEKPAQGTPYIIIYGREKCSACKAFKQKLDDAKVEYVYKDMKNENVKNELYSRMEGAGFKAEKFLIPVVDVNGSLAIRPALRDVLERYGHPSPEHHSDTTTASKSDCQEAGANLSSCKES